MYVAVKGGERAIDAAHRLLAEDRRGDPDEPELTPAQIRAQLKLGVDRVMTEGSLYDRDLAALALKQARGDQIEAIFLLRAYRTTLPRFAASRPVETSRMALERRISATFKDLPGGQVLGPTFDYTHRLIDHALAGPHAAEPPEEGAPVADDAPRVLDLLQQEGLIEPSGDAPGRPTRRPTRRPARRRHAGAAELPRRPRCAPAATGARRRGIPAGARLFDAARLRPHAPVRR
jgi:alpha-D-ribose 1-methylphosphonate 5-triphosphate synthase subunit PhnI